MNRLTVSIALLVLFLAGCDPMRVKTEVVYVDKAVPIEVPPPPTVERPKLVVWELTPEQEQDIGELVKAYKISIKQLQGYAEQLERILDGYRKKSDVAPLNPTSEPPK